SVCTSSRRPTRASSSRPALRISRLLRRLNEGNSPPPRRPRRPNARAAPPLRPGPSSPAADAPRSQAARDEPPVRQRVHFSARFAVLLRQPVSERSVREAEMKALDHLAGSKPSLLQVRERFRALLQRLVVIVHDLTHEHVV